MIPFVDLKAQYNSIKAEIDTAIESVINENAFIGGSGNKHVNDFESGFATFTQSKYCVGCANGTDALEIALKALGIKPGDEVIVPAISWISTSEAVSSLNAKPVFVDVNDSDLTIDVHLIEQNITPNTKAIIPVHLYGNPANMTKIMEIARQHDLKVLEDCAQAHGAIHNGQIVGSFGDAATYSFYPGKNLGAYGDAGAITTNDKQIRDFCKAITNHGQEGGKHNHIMEGRNSRLDGIQAAVLNVKLNYIKDWTSARQSAAAYYHEHISDNEYIRKLKIRDTNKSVYHLYVLKVQGRDNLMKTIKMNEISCGIHYPTPLPLLTPYKKMFSFSKEDFPVASKSCNEILSIPIYPEITRSQLDSVIDVINNFSGI